MSVFSFGDLPPEIQQELQNQVAFAQANSEDFGHAVQRLMTEMDQDSLITLKTMLHYVVHESNSPVAAYWEGVVTGSLTHRFNICSAHGVNHDEEAEQELRVPEGFESPSQMLLNYTEEDVPESSADRARSGRLSDGDKMLMEQYHLDDAYIEGSQPPLFYGFICTGIKGRREGCGVMYPSIEDRMLKEPESCSGCFQKAAHG